MIKGLSNIATNGLTGMNKIKALSNIATNGLTVYEHDQGAV